MTQPDDMLSGQVLEQLRLQGRLATKVVLVIETVSVDPEEVMDLRIRYSDDCPTWTAHGMLCWGLEANEANLFSPGDD